MARRTASAAEGSRDGGGTVTSGAAAAGAPMARRGGGRCRRRARGPQRRDHGREPRAVAVAGPGGDDLHLTEAGGDAAAVHHGHQVVPQRAELLLVPVAEGDVAPLGSRVQHGPHRCPPGVAGQEIERGCGHRLRALEVVDARDVLRGVLPAAEDDGPAAPVVESKLTAAAQDAQVDRVDVDGPQQRQLRRAGNDAVEGFQLWSAELRTRDQRPPGGVGGAHAGCGNRSSASS